MLGYIPKGQHHFGKRYAKGSNEAIADFELDQNTRRRKMQDMRAIAALQAGEMNISDLPAEAQNQVYLSVKCMLESK